MGIRVDALERALHRGQQEPVLIADVAEAHVGVPVAVLLGLQGMLVAVPIVIPLREVAVSRDAAPQALHYRARPSVHIRGGEMYGQAERGCARPCSTRWRNRNDERSRAHATRDDWSGKNGC